MSSADDNFPLLLNKTFFSSLFSIPFIIRHIHVFRGTAQKKKYNTKNNKERKCNGKCVSCLFLYSRKWRIKYSRNRRGKRYKLEVKKLFLHPQQFQSHLICFFSLSCYMYGTSSRYGFIEILNTFTVNSISWLYGWYWKLNKREFMNVVKGLKRKQKHTQM